MKNKVIKTCAAAMLSSLIALPGVAQETMRAKKDSTAVETKKDDKNMMLNASSSTGPRTVNIGLPAGVAGTSVMENGLPVSYFYWPVLPTRAWRLDGSTIGFETLNLNQTALRLGDVGVSIGTYDNLGTDDFHGMFEYKTNHHGLQHSTGSISGPATKSGLSFALGYYTNFDPGTLDVPFEKYYNDQTQMYKFALTQKYNQGKSKISALYKYMNTQNIPASYSPFYYKGDGSVEEIPGITIGRSSFFEKSGKFWTKDAFTGEKQEKDLFNENKFTTHEVYLIGENKFNNNWKLNYTFKYAQTKGSQALPVLVGAVADISKFTYLDGTPAKSKSGMNHFILYMPNQNIETLSGVVNLNKKAEKHNFDLGLMGFAYNPGKFYTQTSLFVTDINENPSIVTHPAIGPDSHGYIDPYYNNGNEYDNGKERKIALYFTDKWTVNPKFSLNYGARLEWQNVEGDYAPKYDKDKNLLPVTARNADGTFSSDKSKYKLIDNNNLNLAINTDGVYKITNTFGALGEAGYNRQSAHLESYAGSYEVDPKQNSIISAGAGIYFNHPIVSLVSKGTFISKDNYVSRMDLKLGTEMKNTVLYYDIQTLGWTTDFMFTPFKKSANTLKNFNLHVLVTLQDPVYKNYDVRQTFTGNQEVRRSFTDKNVTTVSKLLLEIDPSYSFALDKNTNARVWLSARYFSKQYANLPNNLYYNARWETFAGVNVNIKRQLDIYANFVNLLDQKGIGGTIGGTELFDDAQAQQLAGSIQAATYIRPFSAEFGVRYRF